jgi:hypothetical protein
MDGVWRRKPTRRGARVRNPRMRAEGGPASIAGSLSVRSARNLAVEYPGDSDAARATVPSIKRPASGVEAGRGPVSRGREQAQRSGQGCGSLRSWANRDIKANENRTLLDRFGIYSDAKALKVRPYRCAAICRYHASRLPLGDPRCSGKSRRRLYRFRRWRTRRPTREKAEAVTRARGP